MKAKIIPHSNREWNDYSKQWKYLPPSYDIKIKTFLFYIKVAEFNSKEECEEYLGKLNLYPYLWS